MRHTISALTSLTMSDLERCYRIQQALDAVDTAVQSAQFPGKAAVRELLRQAYEDSMGIMRKGASGAVRNAQKGMYSKHSHTNEFWQRLIGLARPGSEPTTDQGGETPNGQ